MESNTGCFLLETVPLAQSSPDLQVIVLDTARGCEPVCCRQCRLCWQAPAAAGLSFHSWLLGSAGGCSSCLASIGAPHLPLLLQEASRLHFDCKPAMLSLIKEQQVQAESELCQGRPAPGQP